MADDGMMLDGCVCVSKMITRKQVSDARNDYMQIKYADYVVSVYASLPSMPWTMRCQLLRVCAVSTTAGAAGAGADGGSQSHRA